MEPSTPPAQRLADTCLAFTPIAQQRSRTDGWTPETQANFIRALGAMGSVGQAAKAVGMGRRSAYRLRERPDAASFTAAWDRAISMGRTHQFSVAMDRALNGVTIVRILKGGAIDVSGGPDMSIVRSALCEDAAPLKAAKDTF